MWPYQVSNPVPLALKSDLLPTALRRPANLNVKASVFPITFYQCSVIFINSLQYFHKDAPEKESVMNGKQTKLQLYAHPSGSVAQLRASDNLMQGSN